MVSTPQKFVTGIAFLVLLWPGHWDHKVYTVKPVQVLAASASLRREPWVRQAGTLLFYSCSP